jgi:hypothetical protein
MCVTILPQSGAELKTQFGNVALNPISAMTGVQASGVANNRQRLLLRSPSRGKILLT